MPLNYVEQIEATARRIRRRRWAAIACWSLAGFVAALLVLVALDWLLGVYHVAGRVALTSLLVASIFALWRRGARAAADSVTPLDVALELERRHPEHRSLLASALEFSRQEGDDPTAGSADLRRAVVLRAAVALESIDLDSVVPRAPLRRAALVALAALAALAITAAMAAQGFATGVVRLLNPLSDAEWPRRHDMALVDPPRIESLEVKVHPPDYTAMPAEVISEPFRVIQGSTLQLRGKSDVPIEAGELRAGDQPSVPLQIDSDRRSFRTGETTWRPAASGDWSITLTTAQGLTADAGRRLRVEVRPDRPPEVQIVAPTEDLPVLPEASVDFAVHASDDLAVSTVRLEVAADGGSASAKPLAIELYRGGEPPISGDVDVSHVLELATLPLSTGAVWTVAVVAEDYAGQVSRSARPVRLRLISREEFLRRTDEMHARLAAALERALADQRRARRGTDPAEGDEAQAKLGDRTNKWLAALARQRAAAEAISGGQSSALELSRALMAEYLRNRWPDEAARAQTERISDSLERLGDGELPRIDSELATLARQAQQAARDDRQRLSGDDLELLDNVRQRQDGVVIALESLVRELAQWHEVQQYQRELAELKREQAELLKQTEAAARASLSHEQPSDELRQTHEPLVAKQRELARRLASALARMRDSASALAAAKPAEAARLDAAVHHAQRQRVQTETREAADALAARRFAQAAAKQRAAGARLQQLMERLAQGRPQDAGERRAAAERRRQQTAVSPRPGASPGEATATAATSETTRGTAAATAERAVLGKLVNDLWGKLPQRQREELLQPLSEEFLPEYAADIEEYFRVLAESAGRDATEAPP